MRKKRDLSNTKEQNSPNDINIETVPEELEQKDQIPDIWKIHPSYIDTHPKRFFATAMALVVAFIFFCSLMLIIVPNLLAALFMTSLIAVFFLIAFRDTFFPFQNSLVSSFKDQKLFDPLKDLQFWINQRDLSTLLITNKKDLLTIATRIFRVRILPENVNATLNPFLKALTKTKLSFTYQIIRRPIIKFPEQAKKNGKITKSSDIDDFKNNLEYNELGSSEILIYFSVHDVIKGILTKHRLNGLLTEIEDNSNKLKNLFSSDFAHTQVCLLEKNDLINAIRTIYTGQEIDLAQKKSDISKIRKIDRHFLLKITFVIFLNIYVFLLMFILNSPWYWITLIDLILTALVVSIAWKDVFFFFTNRYLNRLKCVREIDPFSRVQFFRLKEENDSIYLYINNQMLIGLKLFNLRKVDSSYSSYTGKFFRALSDNTIPFVYTIHTSPTSLELFLKECKKYLNKTAETEVRRILGDTIFYSSQKRNFSIEQIYPRDENYKEEFKKWLQRRSGIWKTTLTLSCCSCKFTSHLISEDFTEISQELRKNAKNLLNAYDEQHIHHTLVQMKELELMFGHISEILKKAMYRTNGTRLSYIYFQGNTLIELIKIVSDIKKGVEVVIAAEFNTPIHLENYITIGKTINTEFLREEVPLGLKLDQIKKLLVTNGTPENRELLVLKIVSELIKKGVPSIIFDFSGNCAKLLKYFENSRFENEFLCFKLGTSFSINLLDSEIKYDSNNAAYLNYFYDTYALAFKESKKNIDTLKEIVSTNQQHSLSSITFDLQMMQKWEKGTHYDDIYRFFNDFYQQSVLFSDKVYEFEGKVTPLDFLKDNKVIIIDVSILTDLEQKVFVTFVLLSKIIHYINNYSDYYPKITVIPYADLFFDSAYLDSSFGTRINYGKVNKFLDPLVQNGFGTILLTNEARYLHPNVFNYVDNIISFKATDNRDIAVLQKQMNLQEFKPVYSNKRNNTYQLEYLANMKFDQIIMKRKDNNQPFPGRIDFKDLHKTSTANYYEIMNYMKNQGYNLKLTEEKITEYAKKTIFELDFGIYSEFKDEIIQCLDAIKKSEKVALSKERINEALGEIVIPKASRKIKNKKQLRAIRENIFLLLIKHGYLETASRKNAAGFEEMQVSYIVGKKLQQALNEEYNSKKSETTNNIGMDPINIERNQNVGLDAIFQEHNDKDIEDNIEEDNDENNNKTINSEEEIHIKLASESGYKEKIIKLYYSILQIYECIEKNQLDKAIETINDLLAFIDFFKENGKLNGDIAILKQQINDIDISNVKNPIITKRIADIYGLFKDFYYSLQNHNNSNLLKAKQMI